MSNNTKQKHQEQHIFMSEMMAETHTGIRIDAHGVLGRIASGRYDEGLNFYCEQMLNHQSCARSPRL